MPRLAFLHSTAGRNARSAASFVGSTRSRPRKPGPEFADLSFAPFDAVAVEIERDDEGIRAFGGMLDQIGSGSGGDCILKGYSENRYEDEGPLKSRERLQIR